MDSKRTQPTVSVIIPAFNRNHTLPRALSSAVSQTFRDLEIIVVDDASEEPAADVVQMFDDPRARVIEHDRNRGANAARNTGVRSARGKYVAFLDSDDEWLPDKVQIQVAALEAAPSAVAGHYTGLTAFDESGQEISRRKPQLSGNIYLHLLQRNEIGPLSAVLVRRSVLNKVGGFDEQLASSQDWDLYLRIAEHHEFVSTSDSLVRYHVGGDSITRNARAKAQGRRMILEKYKGHMVRSPAAFARQLVKTGHYYCRAGELSEGRRMFRRAAHTYPLSVDAYLYFGISFLGVGIYEGSVKVRQKLWRHR